MKQIIFLACMMLVGCRMRERPQTAPPPSVIRINLETNQKLTNISMEQGGLLTIETRRAYLDELAEETVYTVYHQANGSMNRKYIVTEHIKK